MKKIVFCDIDGTLANKGIIPIENINLVNRYSDLGGEFVLVSGRSVAYTRNIASKFKNLKYIICNNGSIIYDLVDNRVIHYREILYSDVKKIYELCKKNNVKFIVAGIDYDYVSIDPSVGSIQKLFTTLDEKLIEDNYTTQLIVSSNIEDNIRFLEKEVNKLDSVDVINKARILYDPNYIDSNYWLDLSSTGINKGDAVKILCDIMGINLFNTVRIGNDLNDLSMFFDEGVNVAVFDSYDKVKKSATLVTGTSDEGGVALVLDKIINEKI